MLTTKDSKDLGSNKQSHEFHELTRIIFLPFVSICAIRGERVETMTKHDTLNLHRSPADNTNSDFCVKEVASSDAFSVFH